MSYEGIIGKVSTTEKEGVGEAEWRISDFSSLSDEDGACYSSPTFSLGGHYWDLWIYSNGCSLRNSCGFIHLFLSKLSSSSRTDTLQFSVSLRHVNGHKECEKKCSRRFEACYIPPSPPSVSRADLLRRRRELLPSDVLTVVLTLNRGSPATSAGVTPKAECCHCKKTFDTSNLLSHQRKCALRPVICPECLETVPLQKFSDEDHECQKANAQGCACVSPHPVPLHVDKMVQDFKELFLRREDGDATLNVQGREFPVHKAILSARSPVLASAFRLDMKEKATNAIDIEDCDPSSFSDFLSFLYYGNVDTITTENVFSLFTTAEKYDVQDLRSHCLAFMREKLSVDTFVDTVAVALQHVEKDLIALAADFFAKNQLDIIVTVKWQSFLVANPIQSNEIVIKALTSSKK